MQKGTYVFGILMGIALGVGSFALGRQQARIAPVVIHEPVPVRAIVQNAQAFILPVAQTDYLPIRDFNIAEPLIQARAAILVDRKSNKVLYAKNAALQLPIASITKLMSAMVVVDHMDLGAVYTVSAEDLNLDGLGADFAKGDRFIGTSLLKVMLIESSNDAAAVFQSAAQEQGLDFIAMMNEKARSIGMEHTHFSDPAGLNDSETYSTASDVALLLREAEGYPLLNTILTIRETDVSTLDGKVYHLTSTDQLLDTIPDIITGKTGNTVGAMGTMALAVRVSTNGDELLSVVLGSENRFKETSDLIRWGKRAHKWKD